MAFDVGAGMGTARFVVLFIIIYRSYKSYGSVFGLCRLARGFPTPCWSVSALLVAALRASICERAFVPVYDYYYLILPILRIYLVFHVLALDFLAGLVCMRRHCSRGLASTDMLLYLYICAAWRRFLQRAQSAAPI